MATSRPTSETVRFSTQTMRSERPRRPIYDGRMQSRRKVLVFPSWRDNPYLNLLALSPRSAGYIFLGSTRWRGLLEQLDRLSTGDILHLHWTSPILQEAESAEEADRRLSKIAEWLERLSRDQVRLLWTVHNKLPHELRFRDQEIALHRLLAERADAVHVMNPATLDALADVCTIDPAKVRVIPHPSYQGVYAAPPDRLSTRRSFGIGDEQTAVLFLGQLRPYKGVDRLILAAETAAARGNDIVLMLAGAPKEIAAEEIRAIIHPSLKTVLHLDFVPDDEVANWVAAADVAVFPYRAILNSGSVHLAATYGTPVALPRAPHLEGMFRDELWVDLYDEDDDIEQLVQLISDRERLRTAREAALRFGSRITPWRVSIAYHDLLDSLAQ